MQVRGQPGAVLDGVDAGRDQARQRVLTEHVRGDPCAQLVRPRDRLGEHVVRPDRCQITHRAVDPVRRELDPAVASRGLGTHLVDELIGFDLDPEVADVAPRAGDVSAGADEPRQVVAFLHRRVVDRRPGIAQQQRAGIAVEQGLRGLPLGLRDVAARGQPDVAVRVDETGDDPAAGGDCLGFGTRPGEGQPAVEHPRVALGLVGQEDATHVQNHGAHAIERSRPRIREQFAGVGEQLRQAPGSAPRPA